MLTQNQEKYLLTIPEDKQVAIKPYNPKLKEVADEIIKSIKDIDKNLEVLFMGAAGLGIAGQGDLDIYILCQTKYFKKYLPKLKEIFGEPKKVKETFITWEFEKKGIPVELYLSDLGSENYNTGMQEQIAIFNILKNNKKLLDEYEKLKVSLNGKPFREYQRQKYEFYNKLLNIFGV